MTALNKAAAAGFKEIVKILIEHGSSIDLQDTVLIFFFLLICFSFFFLLLIKYCLFSKDFVEFFFCFFLNFFLLKYGCAPLHHAAVAGFKEIAKILIEHGSNINIQTNVLIFFYSFYLCFSHFLFVVNKLLVA